MKKSPANSEDRFIEIDENELDKEWMEQPKLYYKWARKLADARLLQDELKAEMELTVAELDKCIRESPEKYGLAKGTETEIKQCIPMQTEYTDTQQNLNAATHQVRILEAGVNALDHRKRALEKLVDLYGMNYFSTPRTPKNDGAKEYVEDRTKKMRRQNDA